MSTDTSTSLRMTRMIKASADEVFDAWTKPEHLKRWSCPEGGRVTDAQVDLRVGGRYLIQMDMGEGGVHTATGVYREIEPGKRLVYTWDWTEDEARMGDTVVTIELRSAGDATEVILSHTLFPAAEAAESHETGWTSCLDRLEQLFA